ncbi:two-CW domain-containing protein [Chloroflexota bacterium]
MDGISEPCWEIRNCPMEQRGECTAWEFEAGYFCWFVNGTFCQGKTQESWNKKIQLCRTCEVYKSMFPTIQVQTSHR